VRKPSFLLMIFLLIAKLQAIDWESKSLNEILRFKKEDKLLIINADDAGMCYSVNSAILDAMKKGLVTSASVMVPCPWFPQIVKAYKENPQLDLGVHITLTSEWENYRWGPISGRDKVPSLVDEQGYLWRTTPLFYQHATLEDAEREARAQIERALAMGIDVTHLDSHMWTLQYNLKFFWLYVKLAKEFDLPVRMDPPERARYLGGGDLHRLLRKEGILCPDTFIICQMLPGESLEEFYKRILRNLQPGVTEIMIHPSLETEEIKAIIPQNGWQGRLTEYQVFTENEEIKKIIEEEGIKLIGYRALRDAQRRLHKESEKVKTNVK